MLLSTAVPEQFYLFTRLTKIYAKSTQVSIRYTAFPPHLRRSDLKDVTKPFLGLVFFEGRCSLVLERNVRVAIWSPERSEISAVLLKFSSKYGILNTSDRSRKDESPPSTIGDSLQFPIVIC